jgi:hypothetical protein
MWWHPQLIIFVQPCKYYWWYKITTYEGGMAFNGLMIMPVNRCVLRILIILTEFMDGRTDRQSFRIFASLAWECA